MIQGFITFVVFFVFWCLLNWVPDLQRLLAGAVICLFAAFLSRGMLSFEKRRGFLTRTLWFILFMFLSLFQLLKSALYAAVKIAGPKVEINPAIIKVKSSLSSQSAVSFLANAVSLSPATICVDVDEEGVLYIHSTDKEIFDSNKINVTVIAPFEKILKKVFE